MDLISLLTDHGINQFRSVSGGKELCFRCPMCDDHKDRFFLNLRTFLWKCHNCDETGNLYRLLEVVLDMPTIEVYRTLKELDYGPIALPALKPEDVPKIELPDSIPLTTPSSPIEKPFWDYLLGPTRRLTPTEVQNYSMRCVLTGRYAMRVIIPMFYNGEVVSFAARSIYEKCPCKREGAADEGKCEHRFTKILYPQGTHKAGMLFDIDRVYPPEVILVEGPFDAIRLSGKAVATLGAGLAPEQRQLLKDKGVEKVIVCYDGDEAGTKGAMRSARELLAAGFEVRIAWLPEGMDPALAPSYDLTSAIDNAKPEVLLSSASQIRRRRNRNDTQVR